MFTLAHLSDPHLAPLPQPRPAELVGKRATGFLNWQRGRKSVHRNEILDDIVRDLKTCAADHIAITGDLVNLSLPGEYRQARAWLQNLGGPNDITLVPGNHDIYVRGARRWPAEYWGAYMRGDAADDAIRFPFLRRRGNVALIGLSTALPTAPFLATGRLGALQTHELGQMLDQTNTSFRIVLIHHPPASPRSRYFKRLTDAANLRRILAEKGAELLLHGHDHRRSLVWLEGPHGKKVPAVGVPSASAHAHGGADDAGYNVFHVNGAPGNWRCTMIARQHTADTVRDIEHRTLF
jgi:3',5'-cyclic AMP phosphodiesterase CpdA